MKKCILILLLFFQSLAFAEDDYRLIAEEVKKQIPQQTAMYRDDAVKALIASSDITEQHKKDVEQAEKKKESILIANQQLTNNENNKRKTPSILIFVSFSMPEKSLEAYLSDAKKIHASVVIRGLIDNSFQKTFQRVASLVKSSGGDGIELNPIWFKRFDIKSVPAVVAVPEDSSCFKNDNCQKNRNFDVMTGDITLVSALKIIRDRGVTQNIVQPAIQKLEARGYA